VIVISSTQQIQLLDFRQRCGRDAAMPDTIRLRNSGGRWAVRLIPCFIVAAIAFTTYVVVAHICSMP
jgi:hypothetical protein